MRKILFSILVCFCASGLVRVGAVKYDWKVYASYHNATKSVQLGDRLYVLANGDLYSYGMSDQSIETYDKATVLNDFSIYDIWACSATDEVVIIYKNGNIDLLSSGGDVFNASELKNKSLQDKTLNSAVLEGAKLYISTNSGIAIFDAEKRSFDNIYNWGSKVRCTTLSGDYIYASTYDGVFRGSVKDNLLDPANWTQISTVSTFSAFMKLGDGIYALSDKLYKVTELNTFAYSLVMPDVLSAAYVCGDKIFVNTTSGGLKSADANGVVESYNAPYAVSHLLQASGKYWAACGENGFLGMTLSDATLTQAVGDLTPNSPVRNYSYKMQMNGRRLLVAGGNFYYPPVEYAGTAMKYEGGKWSAFDEAEAISLVGKNAYMNVTDVVQDPNNPEHHWLGTMRSGIYKFEDYKLKKHYGHDNSPLISILPESSHPEYYTRVTGLAFDGGGNLWMCNNECDTIVRILTKEGKWLAYYYEKIKGYPTFDHTYFDKRGWAWINSRRMTGISEAGVLIVNTNGTINTQSDDTYKFIPTIINQDEISYSIVQFFAMQEDLNGQMWLGTSSGVFVAENPENVFSSDYRFTQIKIARNDGSGLADYLLNGVWATCITIDGANRKWIGTGGSGVYLISADGQEEIHHFTTDDSPLISNNINDIKIDGETGEVFFATDAGLCSYISDAVDPEESLSSSNIKVYPNPIRPESRRLVRVTGLAFNTNVKIANAAGRLVYEGKSNGGEFTWNCRTNGGRDVASGVYYILATDQDGNKGANAKVLILR